MVRRLNVGNALPDLGRIGVGRLHEDRAAGQQALERRRAEDRGRIVDAQQIDVLQLAVHVDVRVGDRQVIGGRQALLLRAVLGIRLHVLAEDVAGDGGDDLVGRHRAEAADRVAAHREAARAAAGRGPRCTFSASGWSMPTQKKSGPSSIMLWKAAMMSPGRTSRLPSPAAAL